MSTTPNLPKGETIESLTRAFDVLRKDGIEDRDELRKLRADHRILLDRVVRLEQESDDRRRESSPGYGDGLAASARRAGLRAEQAERDLALEREGRIVQLAEVRKEREAAERERDEARSLLSTWVSNTREIELALGFDRPNGMTLDDAKAVAAVIAATRRARETIIGATFDGLNGGEKSPFEQMARALRALDEIRAPKKEPAQ